MERTKLTSIRIDNKAMEKIEELANSHSYYTKSSIINNILLAVLFNHSDGEVWNMLQPWKWQRNQVETKFEIKDVHVENKLK